MRGSSTRVIFYKPLTLRLSFVFTECKYRFLSVADSEGFVLRSYPTSVIFYRPFTLRLSFFSPNAKTSLLQQQTVKDLAREFLPQEPYSTKPSNFQDQHENTACRESRLIHQTFFLKNNIFKTCNVTTTAYSSLCIYLLWLGSINKFRYLLKHNWGKSFFILFSN